MRCKYVITVGGEPILLPKSMAHSDFRDFGIVSAGECVINIMGDVTVMGDSLSLGLVSDSKDAGIIKLYFNL